MRRASVPSADYGFPPSETFASELIDRLATMGHEIIAGEETPADWIQPHEFARSFKGSAQAIAIDPEGRHAVRSVGSSTGWSRHRILGGRPSRSRRELHGP